MQIQSYQIVTGVVVTIIVFLLAGFFIFILIAYINNRKKKFIQEKQTMEFLFNQQLLQSQLEMQEQTFNIISQEIHDNVGQALSLAKMQLNILERDDTSNKDLVGDIRDSVSKAITDLRDIAKSLNTDRIQQSSFSEVVGYELARINRSGLMQTSLHIDGDEQSIDSQKKLIVFRIIQEALQNIIKHSKASNINLDFHYCEDCLKIKVSDNGKGFDINEMKKDGLGLQNIINRAALIGGKAEIESKVNEGTTICITTPYV
jgi:two-component system NarL family sensor kinase